MVDWLQELDFGSIILAALSFAAGTVVKSATDYFFRRRQMGEERRHQDNQAIASNFRDQLVAARQSRKSIVDQKRIEALLEIWKYSVDAGPLHFLARLSESMNYKNLVNAAAKNDEEATKVKAFADEIWKMSGLENYKSSVAVGNAQLLVPEIVWATFSAYRTAITHSAVRLSFARKGLPPNLLADSKPALEMVRAVLPHYNKALDEHGIDFLAFIVGDLREKLRQEIRKALESPFVEDEEIGRAKAIMDAVEKVTKMREQSQINQLEKQLN